MYSVDPRRAECIVRDVPVVKVPHAVPARMVRQEVLPHDVDVQQNSIFIATRPQLGQPSPNKLRAPILEAVVFHDEHGVVTSRDFNHALHRLKLWRDGCEEVDRALLIPAYRRNPTPTSTVPRFDDKHGQSSNGLGLRMNVQGDVSNVGSLEPTGKPPLAEVRSWPTGASQGQTGPSRLPVSPRSNQVVATSWPKIRMEGSAFSSTWRSASSLASPGVMSGLRRNACLKNGTSANGTTFQRSWLLAGGGSPSCAKPLSGRFTQPTHSRYGSRWHITHQPQSSPNTSSAWYPSLTSPSRSHLAGWRPYIRGLV